MYVQSTNVIIVIYAFCRETSRKASFTKKVTFEMDFWDKSIMTWNISRFLQENIYLRYRPVILCCYVLGCYSALDFIPCACLSSFAISWLSSDEAVNILNSEYIIASKMLSLLFTPKTLIRFSSVYFNKSNMG